MVEMTIACGDEHVYYYTERNMRDLERVLQRAAFDVRSDGEREAVYCTLAAIASIRANAQLAKENEMEIPF